MFLFIYLFVTSLIVLSKDAAGTCRTFKLGKTRWTLSTDKEVWPVSGDIDYTVFYEAVTPRREYCDERWCMKSNGKVSLKHLAKVCLYQVNQAKKDFPGETWD